MTYLMLYGCQSALIMGNRINGVYLVHTTRKSEDKIICMLCSDIFHPNQLTAMHIKLLSK